MPDPNPKLAKCLAKFSGRFGWGPLGPLEYALMLALWEHSPVSALDLHKHVRTTPYKTLIAALGRLWTDQAGEGDSSQRL